MDMVNVSIVEWQEVFQLWNFDTETDAIWLAYEIWKQKQFTRGQSSWKSDISQEP